MNKANTAICDIDNRTKEITTTNRCAAQSKVNYTVDRRVSKVNYTVDRRVSKVNYTVDRRVRDKEIEKGINANDRPLTDNVLTGCPSALASTTATRNRMTALTSRVLFTVGVIFTGCSACSVWWLVW